MESGFSVHKTSVGEIELNAFKKELRKAKGYECFVLLIVKRFLHEVNELPPKSGIVFRDRLLGFMGTYGDFTRFIARERSKEDEGEVSEMMEKEEVEEKKEESEEMKIDD